MKRRPQSLEEVVQAVPTPTAPRRVETKPVGRQRLNLTLDPLVVEQLKRAAYWERRSMGSLVDEAVRASLEKFPKAKNGQFPAIPNK